MLTLTDVPRVADYKKQIAETHSLVQQLELDLGDRPVQDWSGSVMAVLLHAPAGPRFERSHKALGGLLLGVPDASYTHWVIRFDFHRLAMFGEPTTAEAKMAAAQRDQVDVTLKDKHFAKGARS